MSPQKQIHIEPQQDTHIPSYFLCPVTLEIMKDPVMDTEGNTYDRDAIENWLKKNSTSPLTRSSLSSSQLVSNKYLKEAIFSYLSGIPSCFLCPVTLESCENTENTKSCENTKNTKNSNNEKLLFIIIKTLGLHCYFNSDWIPMNSSFFLVFCI